MDVDTGTRPMPAVLLAAGFGTRLRPLIDTVPKCLVPLGGEALLGRWLRMLHEGGIAPIIVNTHYMAQLVVAYVASLPWRHVVHVSHEETLLGTAGTLLRHRKTLEGGPFMVVHADNVSAFDLAAFRRAHAQRPAGCVMTMMTFDSEAPQQCGILELDDRGVVLQFHEKVANPPGCLANGAVYIMEPEVLDVIAGCGVEKPDLSTHMMPKLLGCIATYHNAVYHRDIGTPESYRQAVQDIRAGRCPA